MAQASALNQRYSYLEIRGLIAQNSALLWSIDDMPGKEEEFNLQDQQRGYQLPIQREKQLSEDFAFLAAYIKDPYRVMATAVEEDQDKQGMTVRIATNKGELTYVQQGLESVTEILQHAAARAESRIELQPRLLSAIVAFDFKRILSRLRSKHAPPDRTKRDRPSKIQLLNRQVESSAQVSLAAGETPPVRLQEQCKILKDIFDQFEAIEIEEVKGQVGHEMVADILQKVARIVKDFDFVSILQRSKIIGPELLRSLPLSMRKLAKYYTLSYSLIEAARDPKYSVFKRIRIVPLHAKNLISTAITKKSFSFEDVLSRFSSEHMNSKIVKKARANSRSLTTTWNVHAEIQLLSFYQFQETPGIPRILSASKLACYLCTLFIRIHGRFQVGGTHGKLYSRWTLPDQPECIKSKSFLTVMHSLNQCLENEIRGKLAGPVPRPRFPNESVVVINPPWSPRSTLTVLDPSVQHSTTTLTKASFSLQQPDNLSMHSNHNSRIEDVVSGINSSIHNVKRIPAVIVSSNDEETSNKHANTHLAISSGLDNKNSCFHVTSDWTCFRLASPPVSIWCSCKGLELFLDLADDGSSEKNSVILPDSADKHDYWVGIKYIDVIAEDRYRYPDTNLEVTNLSWNSFKYFNGSVTSTVPLVMDWLDGIVIIKTRLVEPPLDPFS